MSFKNLANQLTSLWRCKFQCALIASKLKIPFRLRGNPAPLLLKLCTKGERIAKARHVEAAVVRETMLGIRDVKGCFHVESCSLGDVSV